MAKYKVGDRVRIVSKRPESLGFSDEMVRFLGKILTVKSLATIYGRTHYYFEEAHAENPIVRKALEAVGVPGYYFLEDWISGPAEEAPEEPASVHIRFCGNVTVAELIKDGKVVKAKNARCNPKDEYSRSEGARIAVERLFRKNVASSKNKVRSDDDIASGIAAGVREASNPKIGDKFVVVWNRSSDCLHHFKIGSVVTLKYIGTGENIYEADDGLKQIVRDCDVAPYREKTK